MTIKDGFKLGIGIILAQFAVGLAMNLIMRLVFMVLARG